MTLKNPFEDFPDEQQWWLGEHALKWRKLYEQYILDCINLLNEYPLNNSSFENKEDWLSKLEKLRTLQGDDKKVV